MKARTCVPALRPRRTLCNAGGYALIELLMALMVCSVGLLGLGVVAVRQTAAWRSMEYERAAQVYLRQMAEDLLVTLPAERRWSQYVLTPGQQLRLQQWQADIARRLPEGQGAVLWQQATGSESLPIQIQWLDTGRDESGVLRVLRMQVTP